LNISIEALPRSVILTDDPLRAKMLAAHHLEYSALVYELGDVLVFSGSYKDVPIALASTGFGCGAVLSYLCELKKLGAREVAYIGGCASTTDKAATGNVGLRSVVLAAGGSQNMLNRAIRAARQFGIVATIQKVMPQEGANPEESCIIDGVTGSLYERAITDGIEALSILTVSENTKTGEKIEEHEKQSRFYAAARLVFETLALQ